MPTRFLINQCQIITILILKSDNIENSRTELKGIVLPVPSNQIKVTFIIILPFNLVYLWFFFAYFTQKMKENVGGLLGGGKGYVPPLPNYWGGGGWPPWPPSSYAYDMLNWDSPFDAFYAWYSNNIQGFVDIENTNYNNMHGFKQQDHASQTLLGNKMH